MRKLTLLASLLLLALAISGGLITANAQVTATRTISNTAPAPGDTINVTVTIDTGGATLHAMSLQEALDCGWAITRGTETPAASNFKTSTNEWVWLADISGTVTVNYTVQVPASAGGVTCNFSGTVKSAALEASVVVGGDSQVTVSGPSGALTIAQAVAGHSGDPQIIDDADILWAVKLWIEGTPVPGTNGQVIDDAMILKLVELWIRGEPVG